VALGGGHGLAASLRAVRRYAGALTAVVSVADDGGSSGRLREALGVVPPGDLRKCLAALGDEGSVWTAALEHRFGAGELEGHPLGNLLIAGLEAVTGDLERALEEVASLVGASGRVLPATRGAVELKARAADGEVRGQVAVKRARRVTEVSVVPPDPEVPPAVLRALAEADQVVLGPGSLFTSVLAVVAVPALRDAMAARCGRGGLPRLVYVCNLAEEVPETQGFTVADHVAALVAHGVRPDVVVCDSGCLPLGSPEVPVVDRSLVAAGGGGHDPAKLADALADLLR
jgi:uncharacterized cofD-like protein